MPDSRPRDPVPRDWSEAFGALPLEAPPKDSWQRLAATLPARGKAGRSLRWRRPAIAAMAAAIALAAMLPGWHRDDGTDAGIPSYAKPTPPLLAAPLNREVAAETGPLDAVSMASLPPPASEQTPAPRITRHGPRSTPGAKVGHHRATRERVASLQAESARLEALLATSEQTQIVNAGVQIVSGQLAASIGTIDDALANGTQASDSIESLWRQRNALLEQMLSLELRQRQIASEQMPPFQIAQIN